MADIFSMFMIALMLPVMCLMVPFAVVLALFTVFSSAFDWKEKVIWGLAGIFFSYIMFVGFRHYVFWNTTDMVVKVSFLVYQIVSFFGVSLYLLLTKSGDETEEEEIETEKS